MATREELHRLVDQLPAERLEQAKGYLQALTGAPPSPPPMTWQGDAPPLTMG